MIRVIAMLVLALALRPVQEFIDARMPPAPESQRLAVWSGPVVRALALGFSDIAADLYWIRAIQYTGSQRRFEETKTFQNLAPLLDLTTDLDPRYEIAFRYGALFLAEGQPLGPGDLPRAVGLVHKGVRAMPENWGLLQWSAFCRSFYGRDNAGAALDALRGARVLGAPEWMLTLAANYRRAEGDLDTAEAMFLRLSQDSSEYMRTSAKRGLEQVALLRLARAVQAEAQRFRDLRGRFPATLDEVRSISPSLPLADPSGTSLDYDPVTGAVTISPRSPLWTPALAR